jgi:hypothetical protein
MTRITRIASRIAVVAVAMCLGSASLANAHTVSGAGSYGWISPLPSVQVTGSDGYFPPITFGGFSAYRSNGYSGAQIITATEYVFNHNSTGWHVYSSQQWNATANPGYRVTIPQHTFNVLADSLYHVMLRVTWAYPNGVVFGATDYDYNSPGDYTTSGTTLYQWVGSTYGIEPV